MPNIIIERIVELSGPISIRFCTTLTGAEKDALTKRTRFAGVVSYPWDSAADPRPTPPGAVWAPWFTKAITFELDDVHLASVQSFERAIGDALENAARAALENILRVTLAGAAASDRVEAMIRGQAQGEAEPAPLRSGPLGDAAELHALADHIWAVQKHQVGDAQARSRLRAISATIHTEAESVRTGTPVTT